MVRSCRRSIVSLRLRAAVRIQHTNVGDVRKLTSDAGHADRLLAAGMRPSSSVLMVRGLASATSISVTILRDAGRSWPPHTGLSDLPTRCARAVAQRLNRLATEHAQQKTATFSPAALGALEVPASVPESLCRFAAAAVN